MTKTEEAAVPPWAPVVTPTTKPYWDGVEASRLRVQNCLKCEKHIFYPRESCPHCGHGELRWVDAAGTGKLLTFIVSHHPAAGFEDLVPYVIGIVELDEGVRMMTNIVGCPPDPELIEIDMPVQVVFQVRSGIRLPFFKPQTEGAA